MKLRLLLLGRKVMTNLDSVFKSRGITLPTKIHIVQAMVFSVVMYGCELDHKEQWTPNNWCFQTVVLKKTLENPFDCKESQPVHPKGNQSWRFIGRTDAKVETTVLWPPDVMSWLIGKDPGAGKDWGQKEKGLTEDKMIGWHHRLNGHEFEQIQGNSEGQGNLGCCGPWGCQELYVTKPLKNSSKQIVPSRWTVGLHQAQLFCPVSYLRSEENWADLLYHWPPLYPILLNGKT